MFVLPMPAPQMADGNEPGTPLRELVGRDADATEVLSTLFRDSDINVLLESVPAGRVTFDFKNTTVERAFEALLDTLDLAYEWDGDFLRIRSRVRRTFDVDLLAGMLQGGAGGGGGAAAGGGGAAGGGMNGMAGMAAAELWSRLETDLTTMVGSSGSVLVNSMAGTVTIEASPRLVRRVEDYVDRTLARVQAQVSLEARILEVRLSDEFRLGVNWTVLPGLLNADETGTLDNGAMIQQAAASGGTALNVGILDPGNLGVFVDALQGQGQVRVLSSPRVSTLNNQTATIRVVDQIPIIDREVIDSQGGLRTQFTVRFVEAGIEIQVRPQISADGIVTVEAMPRVTEQIGVVTTPDGLLSQPILSTRESSTTVHVPSGQAVVLGGLRRTRKTENTSGVPWLSDVPLLGALFRSTVQVREDVELMMVLVPRIVDRAWLAADVRRGLDRIVAVRRPFRFGPIELESNEEWIRGLLEPPAQGAVEPGVRIEPPEDARDAAADAPKLTITRAGLARRLVDRGFRELDKGQFKNATAALGQAVALDGRMMRARAALAVLHLRNEDVVRARATIQRAARQAPRESIIATIQGLIEIRAGAARAAMPHLRRAYDLEPGPVSACNLAAGHLLLGNMNKARVLLQQHSDEGPPELYANIGFAHLEAGDLAGAQWAVDETLARGGDTRDPRIRALQRLLRDARARGVRNEATGPDTPPGEDRR